MIVCKVPEEVGKETVVLFLQASSALLHPYLQCVHSAASVAKVSPLATVSGLLIAGAAR